MALHASEYFSRMVTVPEVGSGGLERLRSAQVTIVGVGGVGSAAAFYLAQTGVGYLKLVDQDIVEQSNLHRLHGADQSHLYHPKAEVAAETISRCAPWTRVDPVIDTLRATNANELLRGSDVVVDGLDNFRTRYLLNQYSFDTRTPYVFASAVRNQGHVGLFHPPDTACLECGFPSVVDRPKESCESLGVTPTITGLVGGFAANEVAKHLLGIQTRLMGQLLTIDTVVPEFVIASVPRRNECRVCGSDRFELRIRETDSLTTLCGGNTVNVVPQSTQDLDLNQMFHSIQDEDLLTASSTVLVYRKGPSVVSLFRTGRVLINGVQGEKEALRIANEIWIQATGYVTRMA
jgi:molybdopterin/thiamine biosynthesis adenylyltransferase